MQMIEANRDPEFEEMIKKKIEGRRFRNEYDQQLHKVKMAEFKEKLKTAPPKISAFLTPEEKCYREDVNVRWTEKKFKALREKLDKALTVELRRKALRKEFYLQKQREEEIARQKVSPYAVPIVRR